MNYVEFGKLCCKSLGVQQGSSVLLLGCGAMAKKKNPLVFMDVSIDGDPVERMVFELFYDIAPKTAENFRALCTGEKGVGPNTRKSLHYKGSFFHRIKGSFAQGLEEKAYMVPSSQSPRLKHDGPGLLSMAVADRDMLGSHFTLTFKADPHLDRKHVVFGKLVQGHDVLKKIEEVGDEEGLPSVTVKIINCGEHNEDGKKINKSKKTWNLQKVIVILTQMYLHHLTQVPPAMTGGEREKGLGKINLDVEKEETNTETRDKGNKTKDQSLDQEAEGQPSVVAEKELHHMHLEKREKPNMLEEEEFPKENGEWHSNSTGANHRSDRREGRQPDVMDDQLGKSRNQSRSPKRTMSMSISPRSDRKSPSIDPKRRLSRSPGGSRSPHAPLWRSLSRSPNRRSIKRSPVRELSVQVLSSPRAPSGRSISRSPVRVSRKSISRNPVRSSARSLSRSSGRVPLRSISRSSVRAPSRVNRRSYSRSRSPVCRARTPRGRSLSRSVSPDVSPKRIRRGRGFNERYSYARRYRTPSQSPPMRSYRYSGYSGRNIQVTEGTPLGVTGAHCHAEELHRGSEVGGAGHPLYHAAHVTELDNIAEVVAWSAVVHLLIHIDLMWRGAGHRPKAGVHHDPGQNHSLHQKRAEGPHLEA
ncbi:Peptidyl-prolyl cis-trans isomerase CYP95 [Glycine max]|nr:Peptidyl-prolyl cis-trans isomerase CYP95 [Glycine max]